MDNNDESHGLEHMDDIAVVSSSTMERKVRKSIVVNNTDRLIPAQRCGICKVAEDCDVVCACTIVVA